MRDRKFYLVLGFLDKEREQESIILGGAGSRDSLLVSIACEENMTRVTPSGGDRWSGMTGKCWSRPSGRWRNGNEYGKWGESRTKTRELLSQAFYLNLLNSWKIIMLNNFCLPVIVTWSRLCSVSLSRAHMCFPFLHLKDSITGHVQSLQPTKGFFCNSYFPTHERERF